MCSCLSKNENRQMEDESDGSSHCCCCCCGKRASTIILAILGILFGAALVAGPVYVYTTDQQYTKLFPVIRYGKYYLQQFAGEVPGKTTPLFIHDYHQTTTVDSKNGLGKDAQMNDAPKRDETANKIYPKEVYRQAVYQLLEDTESITPSLALFFFLIGCINIPMNLLVLFGGVCRSSCVLIPWVLITIVEHVVIGVPMIVFFGLLSLYLVTQMNLIVVGSALISLLLISFSLSLSAWITVYSTYNMFHKMEIYDYGGSCDSQLAQPLLATSNSNGGPPPLPAGHPAYHYQAQAYYPPHSQSRQLPSAPPGLYPQLPAV